MDLLSSPIADDPQNWPQHWKLLVSTCVCCNSLMVAFYTAGILLGFLAIVSPPTPETFALISILDTFVILTLMPSSKVQTR